MSNLSTVTIFKDDMLPFFLTLNSLVFLKVLTAVETIYVSIPCPNEFTEYLSNMSVTFMSYLNMK